VKDGMRGRKICIAALLLVDASFSIEVIDIDHNRSFQFGLQQDHQLDVANPSCKNSIKWAVVLLVMQTRMVLVLRRFFKCM
jgi:hypothetical protein